ncbi:MAG: carboxynorspermidine decarboxylase, partial [Lentisphaeraceae bacterium]|nr:carboxynorspermidine decarboxylase [Lentisphaeraceae bacterium]
MTEPQKIFQQRPYLTDFDKGSVPSPSYVIDTQALIRNLEILDNVQQRSGAKILMALKAFAIPATFPLIRSYLHGCCASSPHEARLAKEEFAKEVHAYAPAYSESDIDEQLELCDHIIFNSFNQLQHWQHKFTDRVIEFGLRVNPLHSETDVELYNPCAKGSRLGIHPREFSGKDLSRISGLHLHTLCQKGADALARTASVFEEHFGQYLHNMKWVNFGGGHHITQPGYDIDLLCDTVTYFQDKYNLQVYLEPGEAIAINTGSLVCTVLEIIQNDINIAILDISATCHMPDVLEMPYRPEVRHAGGAGEKKFTYRLGGLSCLAGDIVG